MQVGDGLSDFTPTPSESRVLVQAGYAVPNSLLVSFTDDSIDQTPELEAMLRSAQRERAQARSQLPGDAASTSASATAAGGVELGSSRGRYSLVGSRAEYLPPPPLPPACSTMVLPGTHVTPCGGEVLWGVGRVFTPLDALLMVGKVALETDGRRLGAQVAGWLDAQR
jgi:hypothetical protein